MCSPDAFGRTPTEEAGERVWRDHRGRRRVTQWAALSRVSVNLVPLLLTGVRLHPPGRTDKNLCR